MKHHKKTPFMENLNPTCYENKYKIFQILKLQNENETKNKIFPCKLNAFNIYVYFKHQNISCTLLKIVYNIIYLQLYIHLHG
jgi:hypothetical protein